MTVFVISAQLAWEPPNVRDAELLDSGNKLAVPDGKTPRCSPIHSDGDDTANGGLAQATHAGPKDSGIRRLKSYDDSPNRGLRR